MSKIGFPGGTPGGGGGGSAGVNNINGESGVLTFVGASGVSVSNIGSTFTFDGAGAGGSSDHGTLTGLSDDDHTQYLLRSDFESSGTSAGYGIFTDASGLQLSDHGQLDGLADDDHTQYILEDGSRAFSSTASGEADIGAATQLWVSGVPVGDFLSPHLIEAAIDHGSIAGLADDDHSQYLLMDGTRTDVGTTAMSGEFNAVSGTFNDSVTISGIEVGDFLSPHTTDHGALGGLADDDHTQYSLVDGTRSFTGTASGEASFGVATQIYVSGVPVGDYLSPHTTDHGALDGLTDDDHTQYVLADGTRAFTGTVSGEADIGAATQIWLSGVPVGNFLTPHLVEAAIDHGSIAGLSDDDHTQYSLADGTRAFTGGVSGEADIGAATQIWLSGVPVGDFLSPHTTDHGALDGLADDDHTQYLLRSDFATSGAADKPTTSGAVVGAGTQMYISGVPVGDFLGAGGGGSDGSGIGSISASGVQIYPSDLIIEGAGVVVASLDGSTLTISGVQVGGAATSHSTLSDLGADDHTQYMLMDGSRATVGLTAMSGRFQAVSGAFDDELTVSGIKVGDFLSPHTTDHGALGGLADDDHTQYMLEDGSRAFSATASGEADFGVATQLWVSGVPVGDFLSPHLVEGDIDHGSIAGLSDDDHTQYSLADGTRAFTGGVSGEADIGAATQLWVSGVPVGDFLSPHLIESAIDHGSIAGLSDDDHTQYSLADGTRSFTGTASGEASFGVATQLYVSGVPVGNFLTPHLVEAAIDHGSIAGLSDDDHTQYILEDGTRAFSGTASGTTFGAGTQMFVSGVPVGDFLTPHLVEVNIDHGSIAGLSDDDHTQYSLVDGSRAFTGGVSGEAEIGAATQIFVSGIPVGDFLSPHTTDHGALGGLADDDHTQYILADGTRAFTGTASGEASFGVATQLYVSGIAVGDFLIPGGGGGGNPVDARAATGDIISDTQNTHAIGTSGARFDVVHAQSGNFASGIVLNSPNGSGWLITIQNDGLLQSNGPFVVA